MPIRLKRVDGSVTPYKNSEYIPAYLFLPAAILDRCPQELQLPRTVRSYFHDRSVISTVESDLFTELIIDGYAYLVWPYLGVSGYMENYSGYDPVYIIAHSPAFWVQTLQDEGVISKVEDLMRSGQSAIMRRPSEAEVSFYLEQIIPIAMERYGLYDVIETAKELRCPEDYDFRRSNAKTDFFRKWYHTRTKHAEFSLDAWNEAKWKQYETQGIDILDTGQDMESAVITQADTERFLSNLAEKDRQILQLRLEGRTLEEIADRLGYKNHSGVLKRIRKIGKSYQRYTNVDLGFDEPSGAWGTCQRWQVLFASFSAGTAATMTQKLRVGNIVIIVIIVTGELLLAKGHFDTLPDVQHPAMESGHFVHIVLMNTASTLSWEQDQIKGGNRIKRHERNSGRPGAVRMTPC